MISTGLDFLIKLYTHKLPLLVSLYITPIHCNMSSRSSVHMILHYYPVQLHICKSYFKSILLPYGASVDVVSISHPVFWVLVYLIFQSTVCIGYYQSILLETVLSSNVMIYLHLLYLNSSIIHVIILQSITSSMLTIYHISFNQMNQEYF